MANRIRTAPKPAVIMKKRPQTPGEMLRYLRRLKDAKAELEAQEKDINIEITTIEQSVFPEMMDGADIDRFSEQGVGSARLDVKVFANVLVDNTEAFHEWLRKKGQGDLIKETVHHKTLEALCRELYTSGAEYPEDIIRITAIPAVSFRRS